MMTEIKLPAMSPTMEEGSLAKWLVKEGDEVKSGDILAEIETDKATMELEADDGGVVEKLHVAGGTDGVKVGTLIATIRGEDDAEGPRLTPPVPGGGFAGGEVSPTDEGKSSNKGVSLPVREGLGVGRRQTHFEPLSTSNGFGRRSGTT